MLSFIKARLAEREHDQEGFTLIELMVVVLIIAILIAIAIPTFLGARQKAQDRAAQSDVRNALTAAKTAYVDTQDYNLAAAQLISIEPSLSYTASGGTSTNAKNIAVFVNASPSAGIGLAALSASGVCWRLFDSTASPGAGTTFDKVTTACIAPTAAVAGSSW